MIRKFKWLWIGVSLLLVGVMLAGAACQQAPKTPQSGDDIGTSRPSVTPIPTATQLAVQIRRASGILESRDSSKEVINGQGYEIDSKTEIDSNAHEGDYVEVEYLEQADGSKHATRIYSLPSRTAGGVLESSDSSKKVINGQAYVIDRWTDIDSAAHEGDDVEVEYQERADGSKRATRIYSLPSRTASGVLESSDSSREVIDGDTYEIDKWTDIDDEVREGEDVEVEYQEQPDGSKHARRIYVPTPTPGAPTMTPTPTTGATATVAPTLAPTSTAVTPTAGPTTGATATVAPTLAPTSTAIATAAATPTATPAIAPTATVVPAPAIDAAQIYAANCSSCHGANRQGGFGPNITMSALSSRTSAYIVNWLTTHQTGPSLTAAQRDALANWLKSTP